MTVGALRSREEESEGPPNSGGREGRGTLSFGMRPGLGDGAVEEDPVLVPVDFLNRDAELVGGKQMGSVSMSIGAEKT